MKFESLESRTLLSTGAGALDLTLGDRGRLVPEFGKHFAIDDIAVQSDGKILLAGSIGLAGAADFFVARLKHHGTPDSSFGKSGKVQTDFLGHDDRAHAIVIQPD